MTNVKPTDRAVSVAEGRAKSMPTPTSAPYSSTDLTTEEPLARFELLIDLEAWADRLGYSISPDPSEEKQRLAEAVSKIPHYSKPITLPDQPGPLREELQKVRDLIVDLGGDPDSEGPLGYEDPALIEALQCECFKMNFWVTYDGRHGAEAKNARARWFTSPQNLERFAKRLGYELIR